MKKVREKAKARTAAPAHLDALLLQSSNLGLLVEAQKAQCLGGRRLGLSAKRFIV